MKIRILNQRFSIGQLWQLRGSFLPVLLSTKKIANFLRVIYSQRRKQASVAGKPFVLMLEPSGNCNLECPMCPTIMNDGKFLEMRSGFGDLDVNVYKKFVDDLGDTAIFMGFWNFGEPLLNKNIFEMIEYAKERNIVCAMSSNCTGLNKANSEKMIDAHLDFLIASVDGATEGTYSKYRGKGFFDRVISNIETLISLKKERNSLHPFVELQFIVMKDNEHEIPLIREIADGLGVNKLSLKKFTYVGEDTADFLPSNEAYILGKYKGEKQPSFCTRPWQSTILNWDGKILPCCGDLNFETELGRQTEESNFNEVWNGGLYTNFREKIVKDISSIKMCRTCPSNSFNTDMFIQ